MACVKIEPVNDKCNKMNCVHRKDLDQSGHSPSLSLPCPHEETMKPWLLIECTAKIDAVPL